MNDLIPEKYRDDEEIIRLTISQIRKDFGTHFSEPHFSGAKDKLFDELTLHVAEALIAIRKSNPVLLKAVLYQVDVHENEIPATFQPQTIYALSERIIEREFQKVLTKRFFSGKGE
ncbi:MAG: hypothetical protein ABI763_01560 [Bacteroidota bacterium]